MSGADVYRHLVRPIDDLGPAYGSSMLDRSISTSPFAPLLAGIGAVLVHGLLVVGAGYLDSESQLVKIFAAVPVNLVEIVPPPSSRVPEPEPKPEPAPEPAPEPPPPSPPPLTKNVKAVARAAAAKPSQSAPTPAPAAQAGEVLSATDEVVDFGDRFVSGQGASYAGGTTQAKGRAVHAVRDRQARGKSVASEGRGTESVDRSRAPKLAGQMDWDCPFPLESEDAGIDRASVTLQVEVDATGQVLSVRVLVDPGHGFGHRARRCALDKKWLPGLDREGQAIRTQATVKVAFER